MSAPETACLRPGETQRRYPDGSVMMRLAWTDRPARWAVACGPDLAHNRITAECQAAQACARLNQTHTGA
jgi:hypothetical protein